MIFPLTSIYMSAPVVGGSVQDPNLLGFIYNSNPFLVVTTIEDSVSYSYDSLARLTEVQFLNATAEVYSYDPLGNRTSVVITCGPGGC
jgi:hypothetical protein